MAPTSSETSIRLHRGTWVYVFALLFKVASFAARHKSLRRVALLAFSAALRLARSPRTRRSLIRLSAVAQRRARRRWSARRRRRLGTS
jgi:hypothetical protein